MAYCLYVRKSRADAEAEERGEGETLTRHINTLLELAKRRKLNVTQIHKEIVSGETIAARPVMQRLLSEVEQGVWDGVLVMEVERLARGDTIDQGIVAQTFKFSNTLIITPVKDYDPNNEFDEEYFEFGLFMSRREYKTINRRLQRGRLSSVNEGKFLGSVPPFGYERKKIQGEKGYTLEVIPHEAAAVKLIYSLFIHGEEQKDGSVLKCGPDFIVKRLNDSKIKPRKSRGWSTSTVRDILRNPVYAGKIRWNWRQTSKSMVDGQIKVSRPRAELENCILVDGLHEAIIDLDTFYEAQNILASTKRPSVNKTKTIKNPLAGLVFCGKCGHVLIRKPYSKKKNTMDSLACVNAICDNRGSTLPAVERKVLAALREWIDGYRLQWENDADNKDLFSLVQLKVQALARLESEFDTLNKQLTEAEDMVEQKLYTRERFMHRRSIIEEKMKRNEADRAALEKDIANERARDISRKQVIPKVEKLLDVYDSIPDAKTKNDMLKEILEKVVYTKTAGRGKANAENFEIVLYPKIPMHPSKSRG